MNKENINREDCPLSRFCSKIDRTIGRDSDFKKHLDRSRTEFFKALRSVIDRKIDELEEQTEKQEKGGRKSSIDVE